MLLRATTQGIPRALTPISSHNSRDMFRAITQGTPAIPPLKHHQKPCRSRLQKKPPKVAAAKLRGEGHVPPGAASSRLSSGGRVLPGAKRLINPKRYRHRLVRSPSSPGARVPSAH
ncbi:hypothetical protein DEO72_LG11g1924 [Vigna unguiculata]|uniref:Uncharacterized protein n=1 Tax=Vigna unguiculata TaxID=3917 RepID=A0A4D6NNK1_VIGUN|nr:hypothetical protein DEO72_LG11g1924 [Vigna unguiculata]